MTQSQSGIIGTAIDIFNQIFGRNKRPPVTTIPRIDSGAFKRYADYFTQQMNDNLDRLANKQITVDEWLTEMEKQVNALHMTDYVLAVGGLDNMTAEDMQKVQDITATQVNYLRGWADQLKADIAAGKDINYQALKTRGGLYLKAANATVQEATIAHMGLPDLPAVPADGTTECLIGCLCAWRIKKLPGAGNYDCYWELGQPETKHCETCPKRAQVWNPLQIRNGEIQPYPEAGLFVTHD